MDNAYIYKVDKDTRSHKLEERFMELLVRQNRKFRDGFRVFGKNNSNINEKLAKTLMLLSLALVIIVAMLFSAVYLFPGSDTTNYNSKVFLYHLLIPLSGLLFGFIVLTSSGKDYLHKFVKALIKFRFAIIKRRINKFLPYEIKYVFALNTVTISMVGKAFQKKYALDHFNYIVLVEQSFIFFKKENSPSFSFAINFHGDEQQAIVESWLEANDKQWERF